MKLKFIALLVGGLILSTALTAVESKINPSSSLHNKTVQKNSSEVSLERLKKVNHHNAVFDNHSYGASAAYEDY